MRASATSKTASPANYFASQAKADANKADNDSPFALLVASVAPQNPASKDAVKPAGKDASNGKQDDDKSSPAQISPQDSQAANAPADAVAAAPPSQPAKPEKSDKGKIEPSKIGDDPAGQDVAAALAPPPQQDLTTLPQQQILPPAPLPPQPPVVPADQAPDLQIAAAAPAGAQSAAPAGAKSADQASNPAEIKSSDTAPSGAGANDQAKTDAPASEQPKPAITAQTPVFSPVATPSAQGGTNADEDSDSQAAEPAASAAVVTDAAAAPTNFAAATQGPAIQDAPAGNTGDRESVTAQSEHAKSRASAMEIENAAPRGDAAKASLANPGQSESAGTAKPATPKNPVIQADAGSAGNSETEKSTTDGNDSSKTAVQPELQDTAANPKAAPAPAAIDAVNSIAAPQAQSSAVADAAPSQHIQVTAHAAPDLPALAVEIAAKSQSGARQFDIRLDPPELGRVEVRLSIDATGKASAHLSADQPQTLSLLQKDAPILARALRDAGLDVSQSGLNFSLRQQGEHSGNANNSGRRGNARSFPLSASLAIDAPTGSAAYRGPANGRLDIRV